jgi:hypothetical protein
MRAEGVKELASQICGIGGIVQVFPPDIVIQNPSADGAMDMREGEVHPMTLDGAGHTADKNDRAVPVLSFYDSDVGQRVVHETVVIVIPGIVEKDQVSRTNQRSLMEFALQADVMVDEPDAIRFGLGGTAGIEINAMSEKNGARHAGAVIRNAFAIGLDGRCSHEL